MRKTKHFLQSNPIKDWKIAEDVKHLFVGNLERSERWEKIKYKNQPLAIVATPTTKSFILNLN